MPKLKIAHLVDDITAGGVMRLLDFIRTDPGMSETATHEVHAVQRGALGLRKVDADIVVSHLSVSWRTLPALVGLRASHVGQPLIHVEHSYTRHFAALNVPRPGRFATLLRIAYSLFDRVVAVSSDQGAWLKQIGVVSEASLRVITPMVSLEGFAALPDPASPPRRIGAIGRLHRQKGFDVLIPAFRALKRPDIELVIVGEGPERAQLEALAGGDPRIRFTGHVTDPVGAMAGVDAVAVPSRWEAYGLVAREARAAGRPVLVSAHDGLSDQSREGAILVTDYTEAAWSDALEKLVSGRLTAGDRSDPALAASRFRSEWSSLFADVFGDAALPDKRQDGLVTEAA